MSRVTFTMSHNLFPGASAQMSQPGGAVFLAVEHAAKLTADRARQFVYSPWDRVETGFMADSIHAEMQPGPEASALVGSDAEYDIYQHEGTSRGISPAPFMMDALQQLHGDDFTRI